MNQSAFIYNPNESEKEAASFAYIVSLVVAIAGTPIPILITLGSVIYYYNIPKEQHFARWHSLQAILSQLILVPFNSVLFGWIFSIFLMHKPVTNYFYFYLAFVLLLNLLEFIGNIFSAIAVKKGVHYKYFIIGPLTDLLYPWKRVGEG